MQQTELFIILDCFLPFYLLTTQKIKILKKWKKTPRDIIILNMFTINDNHEVCFLRYWVRQTEFFVILGYFSPFHPLTTHKNRLLKKLKKKHGNIIILHKCTINDNHMVYGSWDVKKWLKKFFLSFWTAFFPFTPLTIRKVKILKNWKKHLEMSLFYTSVS